MATAETTKLKRCNLVKLEGRFDSQTAEILNQALRDSMDSGVFRIALDVEQVTFFGSAAIRALISGYKECRRFNRGDVRLAAVNERVGHVLDLAGILPLINTYASAAEAVGSF